jgi:site-specific DNA-methyltransferase (adenine-specific)
MPNQLYYGDNLNVLRDHIKDETVDLIYLDPPFNSRADYNVLFAEKDGSRSSSQITAFEDTWEWNIDAQHAYESVVEGGGQVSDAMRAFRTFLGHSDMMAYLAMMAPRLIELKRVLKPTGSIYLHCDPTASHYLKMLMDSIFGPSNFLNEIVWKRTGAHGSAKRYGPVHDLLLFYGKTDAYTWSKPTQPQEEYIRARYTQKDAKGRMFYPVSLVASGVRHGSSGQVWRGLDVTASGNHWRCTIEKLDELDLKGDIYWPAKGGKPRLKMYAEDAKGAQIQDWWGDIPPLNSQAAERLGYPTQKPEALLERIIKASSNEGDVVLDPFCGCGTAVAAAQTLNRRWIGIDVTHLAIGLIKTRLHDKFGDAIKGTYEVHGEPTDLEGARSLAADDKFQFEAWALSLVGARHAGQVRRGADKGIDGRLFFRDDNSGKHRQIILSVKGGHTEHSHVRDLRGVLDREQAEIGVLITLEEPSKPMLKEAASAGFYKSPAFDQAFPRIQILTIEEMLAGKAIDFPRLLETTFKQAPKAKAKAAENLTLDLT